MDQPTPERIMQFAWGYVPPLLLEVAIRHRVFDFLDTTPKTAAEVATETGGSHRGWEKVLDALAGFDFLAKSEGKYTTTPESSTFLVTSKPSFTGGLFRHVSSQLMPNWMHLNEVVKTGKPPIHVNQQEEGSTFFADFVQDIFPMSYPATQVLAGYLELQKLNTPYRVLDIAAGSGVWGIGLAQASPNVQVTAVDWPNVLPVTRKIVERFGLSAQFSYLEGDLLEAAFPNGLDLATLGHIVHSEGEERSKALFRKLADAIKPGGKIVIAEWLPNAERTGPPHALIFAVNMLVHTEKGDTFSFEEQSEWLKEAGFSNPRLVEAPGPSPLIVADR